MLRRLFLMAGGLNGMGMVIRDMLKEIDASLAVVTLSESLYTFNPT